MVSPDGSSKGATTALTPEWKRSLKITPSGRMFLIVTLGVGLAALNTGNNLLYLVLGLLLSLIIASGVLSERCIQRLQIRRIVPDAIHAGEPFAMRYEISRAQGYSFAVSLREVDTDISGDAFVPIVASTKASTVRADLTAKHRGPHPLQELEIGTAYPFGLFHKKRKVPLADTVLVFPRRGFACTLPSSESAKPAGDGGDMRRRDGSADILGLRELKEGEDARRVHWLKSAASSKLLKVEREREDRKQFVLAIDPKLQGQALERRCEEVAAVTRKLISQGHEVGLSSDSQRIRPGAGPGHERRVLRALAWVGFKEGEPPTYPTEAKE